LNKRKSKKNSFSLILILILYITMNSSYESLFLSFELVDSDIFPGQNKTNTLITPSDNNSIDFKKKYRTYK